MWTHIPRVYNILSSTLKHIFIVFDTDKSFWYIEDKQISLIGHSKFDSDKLNN